MASERQRALVTGGSGFLGACLVRRLLADGGWDVHLTLRGDTAPWRLAGLDGRYAAHRADLRDAGAVRAAVAAARPDVVFHVAAHGTMPRQNDRAAILDSNVTGTANLLDAVSELPYRAFVHTGSSSEVGHSAGPMSEGTPLRPRSAYGVAKAAATLLGQAEYLAGRPVTTVRVFSAYGPWDDPGRLLPYLMDCCRRMEPPKVTRGDAPRDWVHADDVVDLMLAAAADARRAGPVVHAGGGADQTVRDMVDTVLAVATGGRLRAEYGAAPPRPDEPTRWVADLAGTTARTGWSPRTGLRAGVERTWRWYLDRAARAA